jgi:hypothetical protein
VVHEDLEAFPAVPLAPDHHTGVRGPIGAHLKDQLEVAERFIADEVAAVPASGSVLLADQDAVFDLPVGRMLLRFHGTLKSEAVEVFKDARPARVHRTVDPRRGVPPGQADAVEQRDEPAVVLRFRECHMRILFVRSLRFLRV